MAVQASLAAPDDPTLSVTVEPTGTVPVDLVQYVKVQTFANVSLSNFPSGTLVNVTATAWTWLVTVTPSSFETPLDGTGHTETVSLEILVPPRSSADRTVMLQVLANATVSPGVEYSDTAYTNISVMQYYGLRLSQNGTVRLQKGENITHRMRVTNIGNGADSYSFTLLNGTAIASKGLDIDHDEHLNHIDADRTMSVVILVTAATDAVNGSVMATFRVTSEGDPSQSRDWSLYIIVGHGDSPPVAIAGLLEDPDDLWTNMSIHFSSNGSHDDEGGINYSWDFDDGSTPSTLANPVHEYNEPGTYNVTLTVTDLKDQTARNTITLVVQLDYGASDIVIKAVEPNSQETFMDPAPDETRQVAVRRGGWVAYICDLRTDQEIVVRITITGDHPADLYLFDEVHFHTYERNPYVTFVPFKADGYQQGATGVFDYTFTAEEADRYYIVIDNKDNPLGTDTQGPVDYQVSINLVNPTPVAVASVLEGPDDLWSNVPIHFSSAGSLAIEGSLSFTWDFGDGTDPSDLADPVHAYGELGTYTVTLTVTDQDDLTAQDTLTLTVQRNYGDTEVVILAVSDSSNEKTFHDPEPGGIASVAVMRDGWVGYLCDLDAGEDMKVDINIIDDRPVDLYLFKEADFNTYEDDPLVGAVPSEAQGTMLGVTDQVTYTYEVHETGRYYVVIDNKDWPAGTGSEGPVSYTIQIDLSSPPIDVGPDEGWIPVFIFVVVLALLAFLGFSFYNARRKE